MEERFIGRVSLAAVATVCVAFVLSPVSMAASQLRRGDEVEAQARQRQDASSLRTPSKTCSSAIHCEHAVTSRHHSSAAKTKGGRDVAAHGGSFQQRRRSAVAHALVGLSSGTTRALSVQTGPAAVQQICGTISANQTLSPRKCFGL